MGTFSESSRWTGGGDIFRVKQVDRGWGHFQSQAGGPGVGTFSESSRWACLCITGLNSMCFHKKSLECASGEEPENEAT